MSFFSVLFWEARQMFILRPFFKFDKVGLAFYLCDTFDIFCLEFGMTTMNFLLVLSEG